MTVRELYDYSISHSLLDTEVNKVIAIFNVNNCVNCNDDSLKTSSISSSKLDDLLSRREWSIEDVLWLFSS